jgi:NADPH:quinone reductase-like Zn-dependent oxidoreductase
MPTSTSSSSRTVASAAKASESMKAVVQDRYGPAEVLSLREIDLPAPAADEVLVRVHAAGVDPGVWHLMTGLPYLVRLMGMGLRAPKHPVRGMDLAGTVKAAGANVTRLQPGDEVYGSADGTFAEYTCTNLDRLARKPANLTFAQAAAVPVSGCTALQGLRDLGQLEAGQRVLIIGAAGGVGSFAVQIANAFGAHVTGVCSTSKTELVHSLGAEKTIDYTRDEFTDGSRRYDLILDTAGNRPLRHLRRALTRNGRLVIVGGEGGGNWTGGFDRQTLRAPLLSLFVSQTLRPLIAKIRSQDLDTLRELIEACSVTPVIDKTYPLTEAPQAIRDLHHGHARGKLVLTLDGKTAPEPA